MELVKFREAKSIMEEKDFWQKKSLKGFSPAVLVEQIYISVREVA
jgi:hypothetical protein